MPLRPLVLIVPSSAAAIEIPRRLAALHPVAGLYPLKPLDLARALAEPELLGKGLAAWDSGHDALLATTFIESPEGPGLALPLGMPVAPVARTLARTLSGLRHAAVTPAAVARLAQGHDGADGERLRAIAHAYARYDATLARAADPVTVMRAAIDAIPRTAWLRGAEALVVAPLELDAVERDLLQALARAIPVRALAHTQPPALRAGSFHEWAPSAGITVVTERESALAPLAAPARPPALARMMAGLFEPPSGPDVHDESVQLVTAPGEAAEVRAIVRRLMREAARGLRFEEMGVVLPRPQEYAPLFTDLLVQLGVPFRLHPSLPLRFGRAARSVLLLLRCRGLARAQVMELLTFAPVPWVDILGAEEPPRPAQWDAISRDARIVSGLERWIIGLRAHGEAEKDAALREKDERRRQRRLRRAADCDTLLRVVELLSSTLDSLADDAGWPEWSTRLRQVADQWIGPEATDRPALMDVIADLGGLGAVGARASFADVVGVLESRLEWERLPLTPVEGGALHVGALDAMAGLPFRVLAIAGLGEGGYPGVLRPDPLLLDDEREALGSADAQPPSVKAKVVGTSTKRRQMSLFDEVEAEPAPPTETPASTRPATTQDRLQEARRLFQRALSQATERVILSYPRADPRTGRERLPGLFFVAAASAVAGRALDASALAERVQEDDPDALELDDALDATERDRLRVRAGPEGAYAIAAGSPFFRQSHLASHARWGEKVLTAYDGYVRPLPEDVARRLDPVGPDATVSASRLATYAKCGFLYLLQHVLRLEPAEEPEERRRLDPLERGSAFHDTAERFLRELRDTGALPVCDSDAMRARLLEMADETLEQLVAGTPPRFTLLWERERQKFRDTMLAWLKREAAGASRSTPAYFEVGFGLADGAAGEPHSPDPLEVDLGEGRVLRVVGRIDRIDRRADGLVLRDYKTGRAPLDDNQVFKGGQQLQIPFYVLAAERLFPGERVVEAFLDYVDGGRQLALDPAVADSDRFRGLLRSMVGLIREGVFVQEPSACRWCDFKTVCGPAALIDRRRTWKINDRALQQYLRLKDFT